MPPQFSSNSSNCITSSHSYKRFFQKSQDRANVIVMLGLRVVEDVAIAETLVPSAEVIILGRRPVITVRQCSSAYLIQSCIQNIFITINCIQLTSGRQIPVACMRSRRTVRDYIVKSRTSFAVRITISYNCSRIALSLPICRCRR